MMARRSKQDRKLQKVVRKSSPGQVKEISLYDIEDSYPSPDIEKKRQIYLDQLKDESVQSAQHLDEKL